MGVFADTNGISLTETPLSDQFRRAINRQSEAAIVDGSYPSNTWDSLHKLCELPHNWDSYGGTPLSLAVISRAQILLIELQNLASHCGLHVPEPRVLAGGDGSVGFLWRDYSGDSDYELSITPESLDFASSNAGITLDGPVEAVPDILATLFDLKLVS